MKLSYEEALVALQSRGRFGIHLGLGRTRALLAALGHPEREFRGALIAGTNGKGSVLALMTSALAAAGYTVGSTPKPHLVTYRERLQIAAPSGGAAGSGAGPSGGAAAAASRPVDRETFARIASEVLPLADKVARRHGEPTEFELLTAMTFRWFAEAGIDLAVVEVGLGGRLDATHAWDGGVAAITNVTLDHMDRLGSTVEAIAKEKAAIVMRGDLAVTGAWGSALDVIERRCRRVQVPLVVTAPGPLRGTARDGIDVELGRNSIFRVALRGSHQGANLAVAHAALDALESAGIARVPEAARRAGYAAVRWPGRMELIDVGGRDVLLDGAHNPAGAAALATGLDELAPHLRGVAVAHAPADVTLVFAIMADKDVEGVIRALSSARTLSGARVIVTAPQGPRATSPADLAARWQATTGRAAEAIADPRAALEAALSAGTGPVVVAGSLYLVGAARAILVNDPLLEPDPPQH